MQPSCLTAKARQSRSRTLGAIAIVLTVLTACGQDGRAGSASSTRAGTTSGATVWLCRPGQADDPCASALTATSVPASGPRTIQAATSALNPPVDCFYVYPTVSAEPTDNADLRIQPAERRAATAQASRFSGVCRVWAPMYRQRTERSLLKGLGADPAADTIAYQSLLAAWTDYLAHDNDGRPIVFIGHSQGAAMLIRLLATQVDPDPKLRARMVLAILAGGNVAVAQGRVDGATFRHLPLCTRSGQDGCVIAYSSFPSQPPATALFGRPGQGVSLQAGQRATSGVQVACVNPAALGGGAGVLAPYFLAATSTPLHPPVTTPWVTYPHLYTAACQSAGGATWLQITPETVAGRPLVTERLGADWGYHLDDVNLALGNLVNDVKTAVAADKLVR